MDSKENLDEAMVSNKTSESNPMVARNFLPRGNPTTVTPPATSHPSNSATKRGNETGSNLERTSTMKSDNTEAAKEEVKPVVPGKSSEKESVATDEISASAKGGTVVHSTSSAEIVTGLPRANDLSTNSYDVTNSGHDRVTVDNVHQPLVPSLKSQQGTTEMDKPSSITANPSSELNVTTTKLGSPPASNSIATENKTKSVEPAKPHSPTLPKGVSNQKSQPSSASQKTSGSESTKATSVKPTSEPSEPQPLDEAALLEELRG